MKKVLIFAIAFISIFSTISWALVIEVPGIVEAEDPEIEHAGGLGNITGWWAFWSNAKLTVRCNVREKGLYKVAVQAAGTPALNKETGEKWPKMVVEIDEGRMGKFEYDVKEDRNKPKVYFTDAFNLQKGEHTISVSFPNDYGVGGEDRNLFIDWVGIGPVNKPEDKPALTIGEKLLQQDTQSVEPSWTFDKEKNLQGWKVWKGAKIEATKDAFKIMVTDEEPLILSPRIEIKAEDFCWISFLMKVDKGTKGEIWWTREGQSGFERQSFNIIADEQFHTYTMDMLENLRWDRKIVGIALRPSDLKGAKCEMKFIKIADKPYGPAEIRVKHFGLEDVINRAGENANLICSLENIGGEPAQEVNLSLLLPAGVQVLGKEIVKTIKVLQRKEEITWLVYSMNPVQDIAKLEIKGKNFSSVSVSTPISFTQKVRANLAIIEGKPYLPEPKPVKSNYLVGVYYFPGWKQGSHSGWSPILNFPERKPVLGWYQEGEPDIADWHIKWAVEHAISFFAYDWYWDRGARQLEHALHDGYLKSKYRKYLKFCLLWANHNPDKSSSEKDLLNVTRFWLDNYFRQPEYLKIENKPVVIIFSPGRITSDIGVEKTKIAFEKMREMCRQEGFNGLYLVGCTYPGKETIKQLKEEGYDAATGYNYPSAGARPEDGTRSPYDSAIEGYRSIWEEIAEYKLLDYIAITDPGWDSRPWHGEDALVRTGKHPDKFKKMLELAKKFANNHPIGNDKLKIVLVEAWNEFGEGNFIEPHREFGFGYLDAIREVFTNEPKEHQDVTPKDVGLIVKQWEIKPKFAWEFNQDGDGEGWGAMMGMSDFEVKGGVMKADIKTNDPAFVCPVEIDAGKYKYALIRMKLDKGNMAQLFWATDKSPESERNSIRFKTTPDNEFHDYLLDIGRVKSWRGDIIRLRLDPNSDPNSTVEVDYIGILEQPSK